MNLIRRVVVLLLVSGLGAISSLARADDAPRVTSGPVLTIPVTSGLASRPTTTAKVSANTGPAGAPRDPHSIEPQFQQLIEEAGTAATYAAPVIDRHGRIRIKPLVAMSGEANPAMGLGMAASSQVPALVFEGDVNNLAPLVDPDRPDVVHLVFYAQPAAAPVIVATASYETAEDAAAAALKMQADLDDIARNAGLAVDALALLKPLRR